MFIDKAGNEIKSQSKEIKAKVMVLCEIYCEGPLPTYPKSTSIEVLQGVCFPHCEVIKLPGSFVLAKVIQRWSCSTLLDSLENTLCKTNN